jgi:hypothetical protein
MTHRLPLRCADRRQLNHGFVQNRIHKACARCPGSRKTVTGGSAAWSRASVASLAAAKCYPENLWGMDFRRPISAYHTKPIWPVSIVCLA